MSDLPYSESWLTGPSSTQFYSRTYTPKGSEVKAAVVFVHGFAEHVGRYTHFHLLLAASRIAVFAFDQRGFGLTAQDKTGEKSKSSAYGKTSWKDQMADIAWAIGYAQKTFEGVPLFLMGHSMGGAEVLGFATQGAYKDTLSSISGIISTSPLIKQATPAPKFQVWVGGLLSHVAPALLLPAPVKADDLSHSPEMNSAYLKDPLIRAEGSVKGIYDMLTRGPELLQDVAHWPKHLPLLIVHGTADKVTSCAASQEFFEKVSSTGKTIKHFPDGYHELQNEPNGVKEKLAEDITAFIEGHLNKTAPVAAEEIVVPQVIVTEATQDPNEPISHEERTELQPNAKAKM